MELFTYPESVRALLSMMAQPLPPVSLVLATALIRFRTHSHSTYASAQRGFLEGWWQAHLRRTRRQIRRVGISASYL